MISVFLISSCGNEEDNGVWNDRKNEGLKGKVKKVTEVDVFLSNDEVRVMEFNPEGFFTYEDGGLHSYTRTNFQYDSQNRLKKYECFMLGEYFARIERTYNGNNIEEIMYDDSSNRASVETIVTNDKGMIMSTSSGKVKTSFKRNEKGQIIEEKQDLGEYCYITKNTYNSEGSIESVVKNQCDGTELEFFSHKYTYKYDSKKNWIEKYNEEGELVRTRTIQYY